MAGRIVALILGIAALASGALGSSAGAEPALPGDANGGCIVDATDFAISRDAVGSGPGDANWNPSADFNSDNMVDDADFLIWQANFGAMCLNTATLEVRNLVSFFDSGRFNLLIDGTAYAEGVGFGGSTGEVERTPASTASPRPPPQVPA